MIYDKIKALNKIPLHVPGHKRNTAFLGNKLPYDIDITEIEGFDNLHYPKGILSELNQKINSLYSAKSSYALVNGSTVGILAAIFSTVNEGDKVLIARNCHKSVYNALQIAKASAEYILPEFDEYGIAKGISSEQVKQKLTNDIKLIVITSPTYEGVESDVESICKLAHKHNIPVLVDAAHGAHLFKNYHCSDIVIRSLHKTLPALTQCAASNIYGDLIDCKKFEIALSVFETSSPSYVLLSSIDECIDFINNNQNAFKDYYALLNDFYGIKLKHLKILKYDDLGKIIVFTGYSNISGFELADLLRNKYNIEIEMAAPDYIVAVTSICDTKNTFDSFKSALQAIDIQLDKNDFSLNIPAYIPQKRCDSCNAGKESEAKSLDECFGRVSSEYIWAYPPGIPLIVPGEIFDKKLIEYLKTNSICNFQSTFGEFPEKIYCEKV